MKGPSGARAALAILSFAASASALLMLAAVLISGEVLPDDIGKAYVAAALVAASAVSSAILAGGFESGKVIAIILNTAACEALLLILALTLSAGSLPGKTLVYQIMCVLAGSITGCILSARKKPPKRKK